MHAPTVLSCPKVSLNCCKNSPGVYTVLQRGEEGGKDGGGRERRE